MSTEQEKTVRDFRITDAEGKRAGARRRGQDKPVEKRSFSQMLAKAAGMKGTRPATHGHSRHK